MNCYHCDREAVLDVESDGVTVWLCEKHLRAEFKELAEVDSLEELDAKL